MRALIFGKTGQVARELSRFTPPDVAAIFLDRRESDLSAPETCAKAIMTARPDIVINAAAWTAVDRAEAEEDLATLVNGAAPGVMARACTELGIPLLHLSTDYVFDGFGNRPFTPDHEPAPLNAYGRSKLAGERAIRATGARHLILRTSWVVSAHGANFVKTVVRLGSDLDSLSVVSDQIGGPTPAAAIADSLFVALRAMAGGHPGGTYHFSGAPDTSWADFARAVMKMANLPCRIKEIPASEYPAPARRPLNSRLDCTTFEKDFDLERPDWRVGLKEILLDLGVVT